MHELIFCLRNGSELFGKYDCTGEDCGEREVRTRDYVTSPSAPSFHAVQFSLPQKLNKKKATETLH